MTRKKKIEIWFQDEARIGQKNGLVRQWARRGTRPVQPADQRTLPVRRHLPRAGNRGKGTGVGSHPNSYNSGNGNDESYQTSAQSHQ